MRTSFARGMLVAGIALLLNAGPVHAQASYTWISTTTSSFGTTASWLGGVAPPAGGDPTGALLFTGSGNSAVTATNDLGNPFLINAITFNSSYAAGSGFTVTSAAGNGLQFVGAIAALRQDGLGNATLLAATLGADLTVSGSGLGNLSIGSLSETGGARSLIINGSAPTANTQVVTLSSPGTITGGVVLNSGNLSIANIAALGAGGGSLTVNGGTLQTNANLTNLSTALTLNSDLTLFGVGSMSLAPTATLGGVGGLNLRGLNGLTIQSAANYAGPTVIDFSPLPEQTTAPGALTLSNSNGTALNSSAFNIRYGGTLALSSNVAGSTVNNNRIGDSAAINLRSGNFSMTGSSSVVNINTETVGAIDVAGHSTVTVTPGTGNTSTRLTAASLSQTNFGTVLFRGANLGNTPGPGVGNVLFTTAPALVGGGGANNTPTISILPYALGDASATGVGTGLVTYDRGPDGMPNTGDDRGVRPLNTVTEYTSSLLAAGPTHNVRLTLPTTVISTTTINSLVFASANFVSGIPGASIRVTSGAVSVINGGSIGVDLDFAGSRGYLTVPSSGGFPSTLLMNGRLLGSGGLSIAAAGTVIFIGDTSGLSGALTLNNGTLYPNATSGLPGTGPITIHAGGAPSGSPLFNSTGITNASFNPVTLNRDIVLASGLAQLAAGNVFTSLTLPGNISGPGGILDFSPGLLTLSGTNTYTGSTRLSATNVVIHSDSSLGNGGPLDLSLNAKVRLNGDWTTSRHINVSTGTLDTAGFNAAWNGPLTTNSTAASAALTKLGTGVLTLSSPSPFVGSAAVGVNGGSLRLAGSGSLLTTNYTIGLNGSFVIDNGSQAVADRVNNAAAIRLEGGTLSLAGHDSQVVNETVGPVAFSGGGNFVQATVSGSTPVTLTLGGLTTSGGVVQFRGTNLGSPGLAARIFVAGASPGQIIPNALAETTNNSGIFDLAFYDAAIGVRPAVAADFISGAVIQNPANGGPTPTDANFRAAPSASSVGAANTIASLRLAASGSVDLSSGALTVSSGGVLLESGAGTAAISGGTLTAGANTLNLVALGNGTVSSALTGTGGLAKSGAGSVTLTGPFSVTGGLTINGGTLTTNGSDLSVGSLGGSGGILDIGFTASMTVNQTTNATFAGTLFGGVNFTKTGPASLTVTNLLNNVGATTIAQGKLIAAASNVLSANGLTIGSLAGDNTASFVLNGNTQTLSGIAFVAPTTANPAAIDLGSGTLRLGGSIQYVNNTATPGVGATVTIAATSGVIDLLNGARTISIQANGNSTNGDLAIAARIANGSLIVNGTPNGSTPAVLVLSGNNTFTGGLTVARGTVKLTSPFAVASGLPVVLGTAGSAFAGTFDFGSGASLGSLNLAAGNTGGANNVVTTSNSFGNLTINGAADSNYGGLITGAISLTKNGAGVLTLAAGVTHNYTGSTSLLGGTVLVNGSLSSITGGSAAMSLSGGTLGGSGTIGRQISVFGAALSPGPINGVGTLTVTQPVTFSSGSSLVVDLAGGSIAGTDYDQLNLTGGGSANLSFGTLVTRLAYAPQSGDVLTLVTGGTTTNTFIGLPEGAIFTVGTFASVPYTARISYVGGVMLSNFAPVPEPAWILSAGVVALQWRRRSIRKPQMNTDEPR